MEDVSKRITGIELSGALRTCPSCGYLRGFHGPLEEERGGRSPRMILICPSCGERYFLKWASWVEQSS